MHREVDSDNGSEFINQSLYDYCHAGGITFTRSRAWKKNDSAHVEQKNGAVVRHLVGYDRFASKAAYAQLASVYRLARLHVNFFQPVQKLVTKHRAGARVHRVYDRAQTPYQRLCASGVLSPTTRADLEALYQRLNPLRLRRPPIPTSTYTTTFLTLLSLPAWRLERYVYCGFARRT